MTPAPGSHEAYAQGCRCPILDNSHGKGLYGGVKGKDGQVVYVINFECPLHGHPITTKSDAKDTP